MCRFAWPDGHATRPLARSLFPGSGCSRRCVNCVRGSATTRALAPTPTCSRERRACVAAQLLVVSAERSILRGCMVARRRFADIPAHRLDDREVVGRRPRGLRPSATTCELRFQAPTTARAASRTAAQTKPRKAFMSNSESSIKSPVAPSQSKPTSKPRLIDERGRSVDPVRTAGRARHAEYGTAPTATRCRPSA